MTRFYVTVEACLVWQVILPKRLKHPKRSKAFREMLAVANDIPSNKFVMYGYQYFNKP